MKLEVVNDGDRLDKYLNLNTDYSRSKIQSLIEDGDVLVNNEVKYLFSYIIASCLYFSIQIQNLTNVST